MADSLHIYMHKKTVINVSFSLSEVNEKIVWLLPNTFTSLNSDWWLSNNLIVAVLLTVVLDNSIRCSVKYLN